ncbi:methyltransferase domain-containing protein [Paenibacillus sp. MMS20-IR301]|uniref:class I SAM-dependent methyltransferase n=1 Tax=Paenibacillus sp. MMS20-IR301 TaxID=2895946 RepID=UPI0028E19EED|nr:methyltransferase domain-containing protein [Paenibacillus sp. MMS20-IR301]WNS45974.1 methyltransferase domain-containing protein [Paenibacillus sp. MMS20-IR301]
MNIRNSTYNFQNVTNGAEAELLRLQEQAQMGWAKEFRTLKQFGLEDGMKVLEAGAGPGFVTDLLLEHLPHSEITALDIDDALLDEARSRLSRFPQSRLKFSHASVYETGLPDNYYDFVVARLIFLHLHNPLQAALELQRVLKPGGKLVIIDVDDGVFGAVTPEMEALPGILRKLAQQQAARGGNRHIGRSLPRLLSDSGYADVDMEAALQHSDLHGMEGFKRQFDINRFSGFYKKGIITEQEYEDINTSYTAFDRSPDAHAMMLFFMACGTKTV